MRVDEVDDLWRLVDFGRLILVMNSHIKALALVIYVNKIFKSISEAPDRLPLIKKVEVVPVFFVVVITNKMAGAISSVVLPQIAPAFDGKLVP